MSNTPNLATELQLAQQAGGTLIAGMDEVGRGALAGPVAVGVAAVDVAQAEPLPGLKDSKKLTPKQREQLHILIPAWATTAVGFASAQEIDDYGISAALGLAGRRAWHQLTQLIETPPHGLILDGNTNWLHTAPHAEIVNLHPVEAHLLLQTKADATCSTVSAAAITAKVTRDLVMTDLATEHTVYGWERNKGYGSKQHRAALQDYGVSDHHRKSWNLLPELTQPSLL